VPSQQLRCFPQAKFSPPPELWNCLAWANKTAFEFLCGIFVAIGVNVKVGNFSTWKKSAFFRWSFR